MKKIIGLIVLMIAGLQNAQAALIDISSLTVNYANVNSAFLGGGINLDVVSSSNVVDGYISAITATPIGAAGIQTLYTAAANQNPNGNPLAPANGSFIGGAVPSGFVDTITNQITVDMSSLFANHGVMDQNLGGIARGIVDTSNGAYQMSWSAVLTQGPAAGKAITFTLAGNFILDRNVGGSTVVPVPASAWLLLSGMVGLVGIARRKKIS